MKNIKIITVVVFLIGMVGCEDYIELENYDNIVAEEFYQNNAELQIGLNGCYAGMRAPLEDEWLMTEIRSDNTFMNNFGTTNVTNLEILNYDKFTPATNLPQIYDYWYNTYKNIRNTNFLLESLNVNYNPESGSISYDNFSLPIDDQNRKEASAQASFIRAYHYFNLVRLYGGVFLIHEVVTPLQSVTINRSSVSDIYKLIEADLKNAIDNGISDTYSALPPNERGKATTWAAKAMLAKVYLTLNRKTEAKLLLEDVMMFSGHSLVTSSYADVFTPTNEMNSEIVFAIRYKAGGLGQGSPLANLFAPVPGFTIVGNGFGYNGVTNEYFDSFTTNDTRKNTNAILVSGQGSIATERLRYFSNKHITNITLRDDSELDWPVIRFSDVLLMFAEADGNTPAALIAINRVHQRAGLPAILATSVTTPSQFEKVLADERRWEFGSENQRWFDLLRFNTTLPSINAEVVLKAHFDSMAATYAVYTSDLPPLEQIKENINMNRFLLPIPQQEIDTNTTISIPQNPGY